MYHCCSATQGDCVSLSTFSLRHTGLPCHLHSYHACGVPYSIPLPRRWSASSLEEASAWWSIVLLVRTHSWDHGYLLSIFVFSATIPLAITVVILNLAPVGEAYKLMFIILRMSLDSSMACLVFRGLKLGLIEDLDYSIQSRSMSFAQKTTLLTERQPHKGDGSAVQVEHTSKAETSIGDGGQFGGKTVPSHLV